MNDVRENDCGGFWILQLFFSLLFIFYFSLSFINSTHFVYHIYKLENFFYKKIYDVKYHYKT